MLEERMLWKVKADILIGFPVAKVEFHVQVDDLEDVLPIAHQFMHDKMTDPHTYGIKEENFYAAQLYDITGIEAVWGLVVEAAVESAVEQDTAMPRLFGGLIPAEMKPQDLPEGITPTCEGSAVV